METKDMEDMRARLDALAGAVDALKGQIGDYTACSARRNDQLRADMKQLHGEHKQLHGDLKDLKEALGGVPEAAKTLTEVAKAYELAGWGGKVLKWIAGIAASAGVIWAFLREFLFPPRLGG